MEKGHTTSYGKHGQHLDIAIAIALMYVSDDRTEKYVEVFPPGI
jgi:hypothetical protein